MHLLRHALSGLIAHGPLQEPGDVPPVSRIADLYRSFGPAVYRRAFSLLNDREEAMDVTQDTFVELVQQIGRVQGDSHAFALAYQIATFQAIDRLRMKTRREEKAAQNGAGVMAQEEASEQEARRVEAAMELAMVTRGESPEVLTAALLHFVEGCTVTEVGKALALSRKTAGRLLERFLVRARKRNARFGAEP